MSGDTNAFVGELLIASEGHGFRLKVDRMVWDARPTAAGRRCVLSFSAAGGSTEVRAVRAALNVNRKMEFTFAQPGKFRPTQITLANDPDGYDTLAKGIGLRNYHLVAFSRRPGFLPAATPDAIWDHIRKETTTPIDRRWLDQIREHMASRNRIARPHSAGPVDPALMTVDDDYMDDCVRSLLKQKKISIQPEKE